MLSSCGTEYCNWSCLWVCVFVGLLPRQIKIACIDPHQTGFVGKGSDYLQLIKFWPSHAPGRGSAVGKNFWLCLTTGSVQFASLSAFSFSSLVSAAGMFSKLHCLFVQISFAVIDLQLHSKLAWLSIIRKSMLLSHVRYNSHSYHGRCCCLHGLHFSICS